MKVTSVIGFTLGEARLKLNEEGKRIGCIRVTSPPKADHMEIDDSFRVISVMDKGEEGIMLIVCKPL